MSKKSSVSKRNSILESNSMLKSTLIQFQKRIWYRERTHDKSVRNEWPQWASVVTSYASRFINNVKFRIGRSEVILNAQLSADEINTSRIIRLIYEQSFLVAGSNFDKLKSSLKLFCDKDSI